MKRPLLPKDEKEVCSKWRSRLVYTVIFITVILAAVCLFKQIDEEKPILSWTEPEVPVGQELFPNSIERALGLSRDEKMEAIMRELKDHKHRTRFKEELLAEPYKEPGLALLGIIDKETSKWVIPDGNHSPKNQPPPPKWEDLKESILQPLLKGDNREPDRKVLMLWSGDYTFVDKFRQENDLFRLELTPFGRAMGKLLGNAIFAKNCDNAYYLSFVGSIYDKASTLLVTQYPGTHVVVALSEKLGTARADFEYKTFFRQELKALLRDKQDNKINEIRFFVRDKNGAYVNNLKKENGRKRLNNANMDQYVFKVTKPSPQWDYDKIVVMTEHMLQGLDVGLEAAVSKANRMPQAKDMAMQEAVSKAGEETCKECLDCGSEHHVSGYTFGCAACDAADPWKPEYDTEIYKEGS